MSKTYLHLDTRNSLSPTTPSQTSFSLNMRFSTATATKCSVENVFFPNLVFPVNSTNNTLYYYENGGAVLKTATIPANASYNGSSIASALQTAMNNNGGNNYSVTYSSTTFTILIYTTLGNTFKVLSTSTCLSILGISAMSSFAISCQGAYTVNLAGTAYVDVATNIQCRNITSGYSRNIIARIYLTQPVGSYQYYQDTIEDAMVLHNSELTNLDITLYDDQGSIWNLPSNAFFCMTLCFS